MEHPVEKEPKQISVERGCRNCKHIAMDGKHPCNVCGDGDYVMFEAIENPQPIQ